MHIVQIIMYLNVKNLELFKWNQNQKIAVQIQKVKESSSSSLDSASPDIK